MKANELRQKSAEELQKELMSLLEEQFKLRMQNGTGQMARHHLIKEARRNIARVKTILKQKAGEAK